MNLRTSLLALSSLILVASSIWWWDASLVMDDAAVIEHFDDTTAETRATTIVDDRPRELVGERTRTTLEQREFNRVSWFALKELLASSYSYYEYKRVNWRTLFDTHRVSGLRAASDRDWAIAVSRMLARLDDGHVYLKMGREVISGGRTWTEKASFPRVHLDESIRDVSAPTAGAWTGRTRDGIGYLMISRWSHRCDFERIEKAIYEMRVSKGLIIDVRLNPGGSEGLAACVARHFVPGIRIYARHARRLGAGKDNFQRGLRRIHGLPKRLRFGKPVAVLMGGYCASACEDFLLMMKQAERCTLVGEKSSGCSGGPLLYSLPNGVDIMLSNRIEMDAKGALIEDKGIEPDVHVDVTENAMRSRDPVLDRALDVLREQIGGN